MWQGRRPGIYGPPVLGAIIIVALVLLHALGIQAPWLQAALFVASLIVLGFSFADLLVHDVRRTSRNPIGTRAIVVGVLVLETVLLFAVTYLTVAQYDGQMRGLTTPLDAAYFTMTTLMTIGFGDISAEGQLARGVVLVQMLFTVLVLSSSVRLFTTLTRGVTREVGHEPHDDPQGTPR